LRRWKKISRMKRYHEHEIGTHGRGEYQFFRLIMGRFRQQWYGRRWNVFPVEERRPEFTLVEYQHNWPGTPDYANLTWIFLVIIVVLVAGRFYMHRHYRTWTDPTRHWLDTRNISFYAVSVLLPYILDDPKLCERLGRPLFPDPGHAKDVTDEFYGSTVFPVYGSRPAPGGQGRRRALVTVDIAPIAEKPPGVNPYPTSLYLPKTGEVFKTFDEQPPETLLQRIEYAGGLIPFLLGAGKPEYWAVTASYADFDDGEAPVRVVIPLPLHSSVFDLGRFRMLGHFVKEFPKEEKKKKERMTEVQ